MIEFLHKIDTEIFLFLNSLNHQAVDSFMHAFSGRWVWIAMYAVIAWMVVRSYGWRAGLMLIGAIILGVAVTDFTCASVIRPLVQRLRPANPNSAISHLVHIVDGYRGGAYGFPSCHAANTFALAMMTMAVLRNATYTIFIYIWALLQCYSRIYLGVHYPGDIIVGALVGTIIGWIFIHVASRFVGIDPMHKKTMATPVIPTAIAITVILLILNTQW